MEMETKMIKSGNSYGFRIPKALIDCKILDPEGEYLLKVEKIEKAAEQLKINPLYQTLTGNLAHFVL